MREATRERHALFSTDPWIPPVDVRALFRDAGIVLEVAVRGPRRRDDSPSKVNLREQRMLEELRGGL
jgi:hypothetical protein